jgi:hypothetical protein
MFRGKWWRERRGLAFHSAAPHDKDMLTILLTAVLSADAHFSDSGLRSDSGKTFGELARLAVNSPREDQRAIAAERMFQAFGRYVGPVNVQFPRCHVGRTFDQIQQFSYQRPAPQRLTNEEIKDFKAACYSMLRSEFGRKAMEHLVVIANHDDLQPMLRCLKSQTHPGLACVALGVIGSDEAVPALKRELSGECREEARAALEHLGSPKAKEALTAMHGRAADNPRTSRSTPRH